MSLAYALDEFGRTLGLGGLSLPPQGALHMALAGGQRRLSLEVAGRCRAGAAGALAPGPGAGVGAARQR